MKRDDGTIEKYYVISYRDKDKPRRIVYGWEAVCKEREASQEGISFRGFHSLQRATRWMADDRDVPFAGSACRFPRALVNSGNPPRA